MMSPAPVTFHKLGDGSASESALKAWTGVEVRHLAALCAVAREGSFRGAADSLGYVQSAISQQIAQLERITGTRLIERTRGRTQVGVTDAGRTLLGYAERIIGQLSAAQADLAAQSTGGSIRIGADSSLLRHLVAFTVTELLRTAPAARIEFADATTDAESFARVETGKLDGAFGELPLEPGPFTYDTLFADPTVLVTKAGSRPADVDDPPSLDDVATLPMVVNTSWRMFAQIEMAFAAANHRLDCRLTAETNETAIELVRAGAGAALMPRSAVPSASPDLDVVYLDDVLPTRTVVLYWHAERQLSTAFECFRSAGVLAAQRVVRSRRLERRTTRAPLAAIG